MPRFQGLNNNAQLLSDTERDYLLGTMKAMNSLSHTNMDNWAFTERCANEMPHTMWMHRAWNPFSVRDDTRTYLEKDPETWAKRVHSFPKYANVWHWMLCEPTSDNVPYLVDWLIEAMALTAPNGKYPTKCVIGNFAVDKSFQHQGDHIRWQDDWLKFFRACTQYIGWHKLGVHRYWIGDVRLAYTSDYPANIRLDHNTHRDYLNPQKHRFLLQRLPNGDLPPFWHGGADYWTKILCFENGIELLEEVETEGIHDEKRDPGTLPYIQYVDENYPTEYNNGKGRGMWTWKRWSEASSGKTYLAQLTEQLIARNRIHLQLEKDHPQLRGKQHGAHLFSFTKAPDWEQGGFSVYTPPLGGGKYDERKQFLIMMSNVPEFTQEPQPMPETWNPTLYDATVSSVTDAVRLRKDMTTNSAIQGTFQQPPVKMKVSKETNFANGFDWYKYQRGAEVGYFAHLDIVRVVYDVVTPPDTGTDELPEFVKALEARIEADEARITALEARIEDLLTLVQVDIPIPNFTMSVPRFMVETIASYHDGKENLENAIAARLRSGTPTLSQIANEIYSTATVSPELGVHTNVSLGIGNEELLENMERTVTDIMMNEDTDNAEDGKPAA